MTREEAIKGLKNVKEQMFGKSPFTEALDMAIQALSQEPCDDAISRDMALKKMADYVASGYADSAEDFEEYSRIICQLPSVTQKSGKWQVVSDGYGDSAYICECSECKDTVWVYKNADRKWKYCPSCGAKMVEPQESEDKE